MEIFSIDESDSISLSIVIDFELDGKLNCLSSTHSESAHLPICLSFDILGILNFERY